MKASSTHSIAGYHISFAQQTHLEGVGGTESWQVHNTNRMQVKDLERHQPQKYKGPSERDLNHLDEGDFIKVAFINREAIW